MEDTLGDREPVTRFVGSREAAELLGVSKPTLYAYVSRGLIARRAAADGRTSLYAADDLERLAARARRRGRGERATIDVQIASGITQLEEGSVRYRGHDAVALARTHRFEQVAELLWTGALPGALPRWPVDRAGLERCRAVVAAAGPVDPITVLTLASATLGNTSGPVTATGTRAADTARRLLAIAPSLLGGPLRGELAARLARAWVRAPSEELVEAISRGLVLLADHELASSTLAVRVAGSVRTDAASAIVAGLAVARGVLHGGAAPEAAAMFDDARSHGAAAAVDRRLRAARPDGSGGRLPGFGHAVYRTGDPRVAPLLDAVRAIPGAGSRVEVVDRVLVEAGRRVGVLANVDFALGALLVVADLPRDAPLLPIARIAGWAAHLDEELTERPVRYRGVAAPR